jgi:hypothetical protein
LAESLVRHLDAAHVDIVESLMPSGQGFVTVTDADLVARPCSVKISRKAGLAPHQPADCVAALSYSDMWSSAG